jgi:PST family polysaccharide transporter
VTTDDTVTATGDLGGRAVRGAATVVAGQGVRVLATLLATVVLSRLLTPADFGLMAVVLSLVALGEVLRDFGLTTAAARAWDITREQKSNLFWLNSAIGIVLAALLALAAPLIAEMFGDDRLRWMVVLVAPSLALAGLSAQFRAEINRRLRFTMLAIVDTVPVALGVGVAIAWASAAPSPFVLVIQQLVVAMTGAVLAIAVAGWWPGLPRRHANMRELLNYGGGLFGTQITAYFARNVDNLALGYFWGPTSLGLYSRSFQLLMMPINQLSAPLTRVAVPVLTRLLDERRRFDDYLVASQRLNVLVLGTLYALSVGLAGPLVFLIFGPQWVEMTVIFQVLAVGGIFKALNQVSFWAFLSTGKTGAQFRFYLVSQPLVVACILAGLPWGALGVAVGHTVGYTLVWAATLWWCGRVTGISARQLAVEAGKNLGLIIVPIGVVAWLAAELVHIPIAAVGVGVLAAALVVVLSAALFRSSRATVMQGIRIFGKMRKRA